MVSPLVAELLLASEKPSTLPPRLSIADSKESRVRVEGSKNSVASFLWRHTSWYFSGWAMMSSATAISSSISSVVRSVMSIRCLICMAPFSHILMHDSKLNPIRQ